MPSFRALPLSAFALYLIVLIVFQRDPNAVHAAILDGLLLAWTPILIIAGAIFLFRTMEATGSLTTIRTWLNTISNNKIAQLMIVGWAFQFLIEGASGFGTPAAIAAPVLVGLGFAPVRVAIFCLILNSVPVTFGAVGTPTWFGLSVVDLSIQELQSIAFESATINTIAAPFIVFIALSFLIKSTRSLIDNAVFILLSTLACTLPYLAIAYYSNEFPSLLGGLIGLVITIVLAKYSIGLSAKTVEIEGNNTLASSALESKQDVKLDLSVDGNENENGNGNEHEHEHEHEHKHKHKELSASEKVSFKELVKATFPLWGTVLLLIATRIPQLGIKPLPVIKEPALSFSLGSLGDFSVSPALVVSLKNIFNTNEAWSHSLLYVPSLLPFGLIALLTFALYRQRTVGRVLAETRDQMKKPILALLGALVFVNLMMMGGDNSAVAEIGKNLAALTGDYWRFFAPFLGALGSFFSGSATISNLTFGGIQESIALDLALDKTHILALQSVGAAMGNMVCINNIVAVASVLALGDKEGYILKRTVIAMLAYGLIAGILGLLL
ncbi:MAG: lactate permease [Flavobacteriales bacterium]|jgi:lactate permease